MRSALAALSLHLSSPLALRATALVIYFGASGAGLAYAVRMAQNPAAAAPVALRVGGVPVVPADDVRTSFLNAAREYLRRPVVLHAGEFRRELPRERLGVAVNVDLLLRLAHDALDPWSLLRRRHAGERFIDLPMPAYLDPERALPVAMQLKDDFDRAPKDATIELGTRAIQPEREGRLLSVYESLARIDAAVASGAGEVDLAYETVAPRLAARALSHLDVSATLGWFETRYATDPKHEDRAYNLRLAASKLSGHIILPGETFSFNDVVGERTEVQGYRVAPVIAEGELVDGIGGGTCQIASTLHSAAFFSGLEIPLRFPHTRPSYYVKMGLDATVVYPTLNLRVRNSYPWPVAIQMSVTGGVVRAEFLGASRTRSVEFIRKIDHVFPYQQQIVQDSTLPAGVRVVRQRGIPGFRIRRYRIIRDGIVAWRERMSDRYPATTEIVRVGAGTMPRASVAVPHDDEHPPYQADEYLTMTQSPDADGIQEVRRGGNAALRGMPGAAGAGGAAAATPPEPGSTP